MLEQMTPTGEGAEAIAAGLLTPAAEAALDSRVPISVLDTRFAGGADRTGVADSTAAFQAALDALTNAGGGTLFVPRGTYLWDTAGVINVDGSLFYSIALKSGNISIIGEPGHKIITNKTDKPSNYRPFIAFGSMKGGHAASTYLTRRPLSATVVPFPGNLLKGASGTTLNPATAAAAGFAPIAGSILYPHTGQRVSASTSEPDSQLVKCVSYDVVTGVLLWDEPLGKPMSQEYFASVAQTGVTNTNATAWPAPFGIADVTDRVFENIKISLNMECPSVLQAVSLWAVYGADVFSSTIKFSWLGIGSRDGAYCRVLNCDLYHDGGTTTGAYFVGPSTGCSHWKLRGSTMRSATAAYIHAHEGVYDFEIDGNSLDVADAGPAAMDMLSFVGYAYDIKVSNNKFTGNAASASGDYGAIVDQTCLSSLGCSVTFHNNSWGLSGTWNGLMRDEGGSSVWPTGSNTPTGTVSRVSLRGSQRGAPVGHAGAPADLKGVVGIALTTTMGLQPQHGVAYAVLVWVKVAGNAGTTSVLNVGWSGATTGLVAGLDVSTTGPKWVYPGSTGAGTLLGVPQESGGHTVLGTFAQTGTAATVGTFEVIVFYTTAPRSD